MMELLVSSKPLLSNFPIAPRDEDFSFLKQELDSAEGILENGRRGFLVDDHFVPLYRATLSVFSALDKRSCCLRRNREEGQALAKTFQEKFSSLPEENLSFCQKIDAYVREIGFSKMLSEISHWAEHARPSNLPANLPYTIRKYSSSKEVGTLETGTLYA